MKGTSGQPITITGRKMNDEIIENWKRKMAELEEKASRLKIELEAKKIAKTGSPLEDSSLDDDTTYLKDLIEFYSKEAEKYSSKLKRLKEGYKEEISETSEIEKNVQESFKLIFEEKEPKPTIKERLVKFKAQRPFAAYAIPFIILVMIITSLFLFKPSVVGYVVLSKETAYNESLNLRVNESGAYEWNVRNPGIMKSLKASGSVAGNGTVKVYIEKGGEKYLIYKNK